MKKDIGFNIAMIIGAVCVLMEPLAYKSGDTFDLIRRLGYIFIFSAMSWDSYISYRQEKSKKNLIRLCIYVSILVLLFFGYLIELY